MTTTANQSRRPLLVQEPGFRSPFSNNLAPVKAALSSRRPHRAAARHGVSELPFLAVGKARVGTMLLLLAGMLTVAPAIAQDELEKQASWSIPTLEHVRTQLDAYLEGKKPNELVKAKLDALWPKKGGPRHPDQLLDQLATTFALLDKQARQVVEFCRQTGDTLTPPQFPILTDKSQPPLARDNLRLLYGRWLAQHRFYDEALDQLDGLKPEDVVDPAALLFYQAAGHHRMLAKDKCLPAIEKLLENESRLPRRYVTLAKLMQADLKPLKTDSLDEVSRLMDEVRRRLDLSRAGKRVRKQEDDILAKLDKMIKKLEEQQQQQSSGGGSLQSSNPAQDSTPMGGKGPGNVDPKHLGNKADWGNLPPKQRQEALQQIGKDLPAHYREVIEEYFRRLAQEGGK